MTDRTVIDLSYGHVGEVSYDLDENQWKFSADHTGGQTIQQLHPFRQFQPPFLQTVPKAVGKSSNLTRARVTSLVKRHPEIFPASRIIAPLYREARTWSDSPATTGDLFSIGGAVDVERQPGYRTEPVIAIPHGEAGHVLRLIRPGIERHGWGSKNSVIVSLLGAKPLDCGHWVGTGGTIHQISFAEDGNVASTWLAVRQAFETTIFRPMYYSIPQPAVVPVGYGQMYPPSRLSTNPVAVLTAERTGSNRHVDIAFNPYYTRQFAVVDDTGSWSIWDIEGRVRQQSTLELIPGKSGHIYDDYLHDPSLNDLNSADGWHKFLWAGNVSTIVVCNRRHIAIFDIKSSPFRLNGTEILPPSSTDWIRDVKRSPQNVSHLFVLTSSRIFWVEVIAAAEDKEGDSGIRPILSYRHFLDANDGTLKLTVLEDTNVLVLVSSSRSPLIKSYQFSAPNDHVNGYNAHHGSFSIDPRTGDHSGLGSESPQSLYFNQAPMSQSLSRVAAPAHDYSERGVRFYQSFLFSPSHGLKATLISARGNNSSPLITPPDTMVLPPSRRHKSTRRTVDDPFVVPDGPLDELSTELCRSSSPMDPIQSLASISVPLDLRYRINYRSVYKYVFAGSASSISDTHRGSISELLKQVTDHISSGHAASDLPLISLLDITSSSVITEELEQAGPTLDEFLTDIQEEQEPDSTYDLVASDLAICPGLHFSSKEGLELSKLLQVYEHIGHYWLASLPIKVSNLSRLAKFRTARRISAELCLASIGVSLCHKGSRLTNSNNIEDRQVSLPILSKANASSQVDSQAYGSSYAIPDSSPPTPARTPTFASEGSVASTVAAEDPTILRLRQYAVTISEPPRIKNSSILSMWPSVPGQNPETYDWKAARHSPGDEERQEEKAHRRKGEEARRRKRTEKFLNREPVTRSGVISQPPPSAPFGSQPAIALHVPSSQTINELPMTQPDRGIFGSRSLQTAKKKQTKRRAAGF